MDFSAGNGGRIVSDPQEAAMIARSSYRNRPFSQTGSISSPPGSSKSSNEDHSLVDVSNCFERWFRPDIGREQANSALFPHRHVDGVFIIRSCSRQANDYVLSFTSRGKIVHAQIVRVRFTDIALNSKFTDNRNPSLGASWKKICLFFGWSKDKVSNFGKFS